jgi:hypothetical protein
MLAGMWYSNNNRLSSPCKILYILLAWLVGHAVVQTAGRTVGYDFGYAVGCAFGCADSSAVCRTSARSVVHAAGRTVGYDFGYAVGCAFGCADSSAVCRTSARSVVHAAGHAYQSWIRPCLPAALIDRVLSQAAVHDADPRRRPTYCELIPSRIHSLVVL